MIQQQASLDEKTVQKVARGETNVPKRRRRRQPVLLAGSVNISQVPQEGMLAAQSIIGDPEHGYTTVQVISANELVVR